MSGLGKPPAGYWDLGGHGAPGRKRCQFWAGKPFGYELQQPRAVSNADNLTNETGARHLQNCISELGYPPAFAGFSCIFATADRQKRGCRFRANCRGMFDYSFDFNELIARSRIHSSE
jgi:hypothetical protein